MFDLLSQTDRSLGLAPLPWALRAPPPLPSPPRRLPGAPPGVTGPLGTPKTPGGLKTPGVPRPRRFVGNDPIAVIANNARKFGLDPAAVLAYALEESGARYGAVGDQGTSFGPFQAHIGGAAGSRSPQAASAWANSPQGLIQMMGMMARGGARGLRGEAAVRAIYSGFGKGTPLAIPKGIAQYANAQHMLGTQAQAPPPSAAPPAQGTYTPGVKGKYTVASTANRPGHPINPIVLDFVSRVAGVLGEPLAIGTGTNHRQFVSNTHRESAHWAGNAVDIPAYGKQLIRYGQAALMAVGMNPAQARKQTGGLFNIGHWQIIFNTYLNQGGNHYNHMHIGWRG